jgi:hypothetical protein
LASIARSAIDRLGRCEPGAAHLWRRKALWREASEALEKAVELCPLIDPECGVLEYESGKLARMPNMRPNRSKR